MEIAVDHVTYGPLESDFARHLLAAVTDTLRDEGIAVDALPPLAEAVAYRVACLLDGCFPLTSGEMPLVPVLTFARREVGPSEELRLVSNGATSNLHPRIAGSALGPA